MKTFFQKTFVFWAVLLSAGLIFIVFIITDKINQKHYEDECLAVSVEYNVQTRVVDGDCYVKPFKSWKRLVDWSTAQRLNYLEKHDGD